MHYQFQGYYQGPRPQQPRGISHRGGQGGTSAQVVGMSGVGGSGGQPTAIYHTSGLPVQTGAIYQVPHQIPHQQSLYTMNNQIPLQVVVKYCWFYIFIVMHHSFHLYHQKNSFWQVIIFKCYLAIKVYFLFFQTYHYLLVKYYHIHHFYW